MSTDTDWDGWQVSARLVREDKARRFADQLGVNRSEMIVAADAVWSQLNPQSTHYDRALSIAGSVLVAVKRYQEEGEK